MIELSAVSISADRVQGIGPPTIIKNFRVKCQAHNLKFRIDVSNLLCRYGVDAAGYYHQRC